VRIPVTSSDTSWKRRISDAPLTAEPGSIVLTLAPMSGEILE
jgi:hypothetical protein